MKTDNVAVCRFLPFFVVTGILFLAGTLKSEGRSTGLGIGGNKGTIEQQAEGIGGVCSDVSDGDEYKRDEQYKKWSD